MPADLLFEIGTEEIPARFVPGALDQLAESAPERLDQAGLSFQSAAAVGTPRRIALLVGGLSGRPEPELLAGLADGLTWPAQMRWGAREDGFVRPVHWVVALYGGEVIPLSFRGVRSGRFSRGHRFLAPAPIELDGDREGYLRALRKAFVIVDPTIRRDSIAGELRRIEEDVGARARVDAALLDEVAHLVEYPVGVSGEFDERYLELPEDVLLSAMRAPPGYFAFEDKTGALVNRFATIAGTITRDPDAVRRGNERALAARLANARQRAV